MGTPVAAAVADAFGLGRPLGDLVPHAYSSQQTWQLDTVDGRVLVKRVAREGWRDEHEEAMRFERRARAAGVAMPAAVPSATGGYVADVDGLGEVRAYGWIDGRPLDDTDDVAAWLGLTLALLHGIEPLAHAEPLVYGLHPERQWRDWLAEGRAAGRAWAPALRRHLDDVLAASHWIDRAFRNAGDYVVTHRDIEPWNVLIGPAGPVLVDWDVAGPDSAGLEAAHAIVAFAVRGRRAPDAGAVHRAVAAYRAHGGRLAGGPHALARRAGLRLSRLGERLAITLGHLHPGAIDPAAAEARAAQQLADLPGLVADLARWSALLT